MPFKVLKKLELFSPTNYPDDDPITSWDVKFAHRLWGIRSEFQWPTKHKTAREKTFSRPVHLTEAIHPGKFDGIHFHNKVYTTHFHIHRRGKEEENDMNYRKNGSKGRSTFFGSKSVSIDIDRLKPLSCTNSYLCIKKNDSRNINSINLIISCRQYSFLEETLLFLTSLEIRFVSIF